jgi:hypothetical protein
MDFSKEPIEGSGESPIHQSQGSKQTPQGNSDNRHKSANVPIRYELQYCSPRDTEGGASNTYRPLRAIQPGNTERCTSDEDDKHLSTNHQGVDHHKPSVFQNTLEDIEPVVQSTTVQFVKDLHPDEGVEDDRVEFKLLLVILGVVVEDLVACKVQCETEG